MRAAEFARDADVPLLGVNLGHIGFLAEAESANLADAVRRIAEHDYDVEERLTLEVEVVVGDEVVWRSWALNEASVEKSLRERMIDVVVEIDGRPLSQFGCDGVVLATATGSTAYAFSAGGPVVWPDVDALLVVPLNAHALFARPVVVTPRSTLEVEVLSAETPEWSGATGGAAPSSFPARGYERSAASNGQARPADPWAVHRPARREVRLACARLARRRPPARIASESCSKNCASAISASSTTPCSSLRQA